MPGSKTVGGEEMEVGKALGTINPSRPLYDFLSTSSCGEEVWFRIGLEALRRYQLGMQDM